MSFLKKFTQYRWRIIREKLLTNILWKIYFKTKYFNEKYSIITFTDLQRSTISYYKKLSKITFSGFIVNTLIFIVSIPIFSKEQISLDEEDIVFVGNITSNQKNSFQPSLYCLEDEKTLYQGFDYRVKDFNLLLSNSVKVPKKKAKETYVVLGKYKTNAYSVINKIGECDLDTFGGDLRFQQIRLDWLPIENREAMGSPISWVPGITNRKRLEELVYFEVKSIFKSKFITYKKTNEDLVIKIKNPLSTSIKDAKLIAHYEGGRGKPMPHYKNFPIPEIKHKQTIRKTLPLTIHDSKKKFYNLYEIELVSESEKLRLDISIFL